MTIILFTTRASNTISDELAGQGHEVYEALAISEVLALVEQHPASQIPITPEVAQKRASVIQQHWPTIRMHGQFRLMDVSAN